MIWFILCCYKDIQMKKINILKFIFSSNKCFSKELKHSIGINNRFHKSKQLLFPCYDYEYDDTPDPATIQELTEYVQSITIFNQYFKSYVNKQTYDELFRNVTNRRGDYERATCSIRSKIVNILLTEKIEHAIIKDPTVIAEIEKHRQHRILDIKKHKEITDEIIEGAEEELRLAYQKQDHYTLLLRKYDEPLTSLDPTYMYDTAFWFGLDYENHVKSKKLKKN